MYNITLQDDPEIVPKPESREGLEFLTSLVNGQGGDKGECVFLSRLWNYLLTTMLNIDL